MSHTTQSTEAKPITVFISYSHDSTVHEVRVRGIAHQLIEHGFDCKLDQFESDPPEGWPEWSKRQIAESDFVLVVFTPGYAKQTGRETGSGQGGGRGGRWEWLLIQQHLYDDFGIAPRFIPIVFAQEDAKHVETPLRGRQTYRMNDPAGFTALVERLARPSWERYAGLFRLGEFRVAFVPFLNPNGQPKGVFKMRATSVIRSAVRYELPEEFKSTTIEQPFDDLAACRLLHFTRKPPAQLEFTLSQIKYSDYLKSGEHLDDALPSDSSRTFRQEFAKLVPKPDVNLRNFPLTNICGVGLFVVTRDREVLTCRHSVKSHVYPLRWTFSASGTMRWGAWPNPFTEVIWKCRQEINHQVNPARLELIELGVDARKLFFECCFVEQTEMSTVELEQSLPRSLEYELLPLSPITDFVERVLEGCWEPAAEVVLLMLALKEHGTGRTLRVLNALRDRWKRHLMIDEWDLRASRHGCLAVMSVRYPPKQLETASSQYVAKVLRFIGVDIKGKRVLEVGSGIGRITRQLVRVCKHVTCIDLCERMNQRNEEQLGNTKGKVRLEKCFIQEFEPKKRTVYDVVICSLVLIHNVTQDDFEKAVSVMCKFASVVFVFEDVTPGRGTSPHTRLCSVVNLKAVFERCGFTVEKESRYNLFGDKIAFLKFVRTSTAD